MNSFHHWNASQSSMFLQVFLCFMSPVIQLEITGPCSPELYRRIKNERIWLISKRKIKERREKKISIWIVRFRFGGTAWDNTVLLSITVDVNSYFIRDIWHKYEKPRFIQNPASAKHENWKVRNVHILVLPDRCSNTYMSESNMSPTLYCTKGISILWLVLLLQSLWRMNPLICYY
jgi:hypothetical protein